jgi:hypothetical protein
MRGYLTIDPVAARGSYSISVRRGSAGSSRSGPGVQETGALHFTLIRITSCRDPADPDSGSAGGDEG